MQALAIDIWSDIACPWCWVGKRHLEAALEKFPHPVKITWHAFELDPSTPKKLDDALDYVERLARKYRVSRTQAQTMIDRMVGVGASVGLEYRFDRAQLGNTFDAHRLLRLALERGQQHALEERLFSAYMTEGRLVSDHDELVDLAQSVGIDAERAQAMLSSDEYAAEVRADQEAAREIGISGVPFFVLGGRFAVAGAQPAELLLASLQRAWAEGGERIEVVSVDAAKVPDGAVCGPDGCRIPGAPAPP